MSCVLCRKVADALLDIMNAMASPSVVDGRWMFAVPLYHLLTNAVKPFSRTSVHSATSHRDPKCEWWGIADFKELVERFKNIHRSAM